MPKRRLQRPKKVQETFPELDETVDPNDDDYMYDDVDKFHREKEKSMLGAFEDDDHDDNFYQQNQEEVLPVGYDSDSDEDEIEDDEVDDEDDEAVDDEVDDEVDGDEESDDDDDDESSDDDDEKEDEDDLPGVISSKAWGKSRSRFYGHEKHDKLEGFDRDEALDKEEEELRKRDLRLEAEIDYSLVNVKPTTTGDDSQVCANVAKAGAGTNKIEAEKVEVDYSSLTQEEGWKIIYQNHPEVEYLKKDAFIYEKQMNEMDKLCPLIQLGKIGPHLSSWIVSRFELCRIYLGHTCHYFRLIAMKKPFDNHEIHDELSDTIKMLKEGDSSYERIKPHLSYYGKKLANLTNEEKKKLEEEPFDLMMAYEDHIHLRQSADSTTDDQKTTRKRKNKKDGKVKNKKLKLSGSAARVSLEDQLKQGEEKTEEKEKEIEDDDEYRRGVGRQIMKNTGYDTKAGKSSKQRKMERNPRVKHREKFRRAVIKRKGQVKSYKPEINKYQGEMSGINAGVIRSRKLH